MKIGSAKVIIVGILLIISGRALSQNDLSYYLPEIEYDNNITSPKEKLNFEIGDQHITHDQLVYYLEEICSQSENCKFTEYARSHENRPLVYLTISSIENIQSVDSLKSEHRKLVDKSVSGTLDIDNIPLILYQGYSIHGNESSGGNAAALVSYYLLAGKSDQLNKLLENTIILLDPCYNPDGFQRFSSWTNMHRHATTVSDPRSREFNEVWPQGRTNHYWFDLNRDWIFNVHPESKGRIETFHEWKPDILTDHHEMGSNSTFFFQPGIPSRTNPNTPQINQDITEKIGNYHASFLDSIGSMYFSKESYDDYYYGKGSTYPDINGCIGILFEQASSRGYLRETNNGLLSFPFTIRNQVVTSLSTQKAALNLKNEILNYKRDYFADITRPELEGYYIFTAEDYYKASFFIDLLNRHDINVYQHDNTVLKNHGNFDEKSSYIVPKDQIQSGLIKTIFEKVNQFRDSLFYDVSAWTIPLAFGFPYAESEKSINVSDFKQIKELVLKSIITIDSNAYAIAVNWKDYLAPKVLNNILNNDIQVKVITENSHYYSQGQTLALEPGTIVIPLNTQEKWEKKKLIDFVSKLAEENNISLWSIDSGNAITGHSIGSSKHKTLSKTNVAMIVGEGINRYDAGSCWYQLDQRFGIGSSMIDLRQIRSADLSRYDVIIMPDGRYNQLSLAPDKLKSWISNGGTLIALRGAINYLTNQKIIELKRKSIEQEKPNPKSYKTSRNNNRSQVIGGAIFKADIDLEHPLFYGYEKNTLAVFKRGIQFFEPTENGFANPMKYSNDPLLSGYASDYNIENSKGASAVQSFGLGRGKVISLLDNPNFRGYWLGGSRLYANAIFFSKLIENGGLQR